MKLFSATVPVDRRGTSRVALAVPESLNEHRARWGRIDSAELLGAVESADLRGCGGAGFPVARKWQTAIDAGGRALLVVNGAESEPASAKDAALMQLRPHLVIDGITATAHATGATDAVLWLHRGADHSRTSLERALVERAASGVVDVPIRVAEGPAAYLTGESSSIVRALSGGPALPRRHTVPAAVRGVDGRPTLVHNVETLARVAALAAGTPLTGLLLTVTSSSGQTVIDGDGEDTLENAARGAGVNGTSHVLLGGYGGTWHEWTSVAHRTLRSLESLISAGIVLAIPASTCGVAVTAQVLRYLAESSARQCGPCLFGLGDLVDVMDRVESGRGRRSDVDRLRSISASVAGRGACHHPDGAIRMLASALITFDADLARHRRSAHCGKRHDSDLLTRVAA
jgi:NADH:ubiquinone oxidoreductase subunit F (NADH-binding)